MVIAIGNLIWLCVSVGILFYKLYQLYVDRPARPVTHFILMAASVATICLTMVNMVRH